MKSILFLVPKMNGIGGRYNECWPEELCKKIDKGKWRVVTPSVLLLAAIAREESYEAEVVDEEFREVDTDKSYDIVCIYAVTPNAKRAYWYAGIFRNSGSWIVLGGVHVYHRRAEARQNCHTLMLGEGEYIFRAFLKDYRMGKAKSRYEQTAGTVDIKDSPIPLYELLNQEERKLVPIQTARGCPHNCRFCNVNGIYGAGFRSKGLEQLRKELKAIRNHTKSGYLYVTNDNIFASDEHFKQLLKIFEEIPFYWYAHTDISFGTKEKQVAEAYKNGLRQVLIGLESIDRNNLRRLDSHNFKYRYLKQYKEHIKRIQSGGIGVIGSFMVGQRNDRETTFQYLEEFIYETKLYGASITVMTPYPGTRLYDSQQKEGRIGCHDWDRYTIYQPVMDTEYLTADKLNQLYLKLLLKINSEEYQNQKMRYFVENYKELGK